MGLQPRSEFLADLGLADAGLAAESESGAELDVGLLHDLGEPADDPVAEEFVALGDVVTDVGEKLAAVTTRARLDREALPQIVIAGARAGWCELDALELVPP